LAVFTEDLADGSYVVVAAPVTPKPHHSAGRSHGASPKVEPFAIRKHPFKLDWGG
jgi:hypothetical protein